ncbi:MAG: pyridoxamine 5'-phosphate oxidase family protein [Bryobacteraceae bacterium]
MKRDELLAFMRREPYAVQASVSGIGEPQAAVVGIVVSDRFELFFDTLATSRKAINLRRNSSVAFVVGPADSSVEQTVQYEGIADEPTGSELEILLDLSGLWTFASAQLNRRHDVGQDSSCAGLQPGWRDPKDRGEILLDLYYARFPEGRSRREWPGITYFRAKPKWIQYSNYGVDPPEIITFGEQELT